MGTAIAQRNIQRTRRVSIIHLRACLKWLILWGFLFVLVTFEPILDGFLRFCANPEIKDGGPRGQPIRNDYVIITSCDVNTS